MATAYFDPEGDAMLLPAQYRGAKEIIEIAATAEADLINYFTSNRPSAFGYMLPDDGTTFRRYVHLDGYALDAADAKPGFRAAMAQAISEVVKQNLAQLRKELLVASSTGKEKAVTYQSDADDTIPESALRWLRPYDLTDPPLCV